MKLLTAAFIILLASCSKEKAVTPVQAIEVVPARDYQIEMSIDSIYIYDGKRLVGAIPFEWGENKFEDLIMSDNQ